MKKGKEIELLISDLALGGQGFVKVDGFAVFVDQAIPGDRVRARIVKKKKKYAEARILELISPSAHRIAPLCPYSGWCGGCKWQTLPYGKQLEYKRRHVRDALSHIGLMKEVPVHETLASPDVFGYRNKMEFTCSDRRWLMPEELACEDIVAGLGIGLHVPGTFHKVLDIKKCLLMPTLGNDILEDVRRYIQSSALPVYGLKTHEGFWRFLMLRHSAAFDQWMLNIITAGHVPDAVHSLASLIVEKYPNVVSVVNNITARKASIAVGESEVLLAGEPSIRDKIGRYAFQISANSFFQTNTAGAERLYETVKQYAQLSGGERVLDLYCGTGTIGIYLSDTAREVVGIELVESAIDDARRNAHLNGADNCRFIQGDIKTALSDVDGVPDVLIIDPPRVGMHKDVLKQVMAMAPQKMVYVSCNPATLARDLGQLQDVYRVVEVQPVDMFPHTFHVEAVARLRKKVGINV